MKYTAKSLRPFAMAAFVGGFITYSFVFLFDDSSLSYQSVTTEKRLVELESLVEQQQKEISYWREQHSRMAPVNNAIDSASESVNKKAEFNIALNDKRNLELSIPDRQQTLKDLSTFIESNPRTFSERITDYLSSESDVNAIALAAKVMSDMAGNSVALPNFELEAVYQKQTNPEIKRVAAQVLSMRGDNSLLEKEISDAQQGLQNKSSEVRQKTLVMLAKTRYAGAANTIAPLLQDESVSVKLDALLALRSTGNESHVAFVQPLVNHPDPSISWLAKDVINQLQNLSEKARTHLSADDITAELPVIPGV